MRASKSVHAAAPAVSWKRTGGEHARPVAEARPARGVSWKLRLRVLATRARLDREIVAGGLCEATDALALRTSQLTDARNQRQIAANLRRIVAYADRPESAGASSAVVIAPPAVRSGRDALLGLAQRLEQGEPVSPRGIVLAQRMLTDGLSPLFDPVCRQTVTQAAHEIYWALDELPATGFDALAA
ncbi:MAG: hypothetical protein ACYDHN_05435 [Solirubrobacteraceae bacterium]